MSEKTIVITESEGAYRIRNADLSEFEMIGILECMVFDLKSARRHEASGKTTELSGVAEETTKDSEETASEPKITEQPKEIPPPAGREMVQPAAASPELHTRINNAVKAIKNLGGEVGDVNRSEATDEELQTELEELTNQYKRLKNSKGK